MALEGALKEFGLPDILQLIGQQKKTGVLTLSDKDETVKVSFERGAVVWAESSKREVYSRLGQVLVFSGKITEDDLAEALQIQGETLQKIGHVLIKMGKIDMAALKNALQVQVLDTVYQLFRWKVGNYSFSQENVSYDADLVTPVNSEHLLMEGVRMMDEWPIIEEMIHSKDIVYRVRENAEPLSSPLQQDEEQVIMLLDGKRNVQDVIDASGLNEFDTCKILLVLENIGLTEKTGEEKAAVTFKPVTRVAGLETKASFNKELAFFAATLVLAAAIMLKSFGLWPFPASSGPFANSVTQERLARVQSAVTLYKLEKGTYPTKLDDLEKAGLVSDNTLKDALNRPFEYKVEGRNFTVSPRKNQ